MKHHKKQYRRILIGMLLLGSTAAIMNACAWDDSLYREFVIEDDEGGHVVSCSNLQKIMIYSYEEEEQVTTTQVTTTYEKEKNEGDFANAFTYNLCPEKAHNCIYGGDGENKTGICNNCPKNHAVCKDKCVDITQPNLHIQECILDNLTCKEGYYDFNDDSSDGCEFRLSPVNIDKTRPQNPDGSWNCVNGYADLDGDRYSGCEVNGWTDNAHCGAGIIKEDGTRKTGVQCEDYEVCKSGTCAESCGEETYMVVCGGQCVNTNIDNAHCGGCNRTCSLSDNDTRAAVACQDGGCHAIACQPGYYLADGTDETGKDIKKCEPCNENEYTTSATATGCKVCPTTTGAKSMVFDADNNICKAASCLEGYQLKDGSCEPCAPGTYSKTSDTAQCKTCDMKCTECPDGHFSGHAASSCTKCPAGTHTVGDDRTECKALNCQSGEHVNGNACEEDSKSNCGAPRNECIQLNHGTSACTNGQCVYTCEAGYYWEDNCNDDQGRCCIQCPEGSYCPTAGLTSPIPCPVGHYCPNKDSDECTEMYCQNNRPTPCPEGTYQENIGSTKCEPCGDNQISAAGSAMCAECKGNTHANDNHTACVGCNNVGNVDDTCVKTTGAATMRCSSQNICKAASCLPGYKLVDNEKCEPCPAGSISTSDNKCTQCLAGTYANATNNTCTNCPKGSYCPTAGLTSPIDCPKGHYCGEGSSDPTACPEGTYRNTKNGKSESDCSNCPKGRYNDGEGAHECPVIPAGYVGVNCKSDPEPYNSTAINSDDFNKKEGCAQYATCYDGHDQFKCSMMYGNEHVCDASNSKCHKGTEGISCTVNHPGV